MIFDDCKWTWEAQDRGRKRWRGGERLEIYSEEGSSVIPSPSIFGHAS